ncbi:MAG: hypothetical protein EPN33_05295 [Acidobacteria bacterium]|nr:MAG: hypothetical protein EPN33_05295 [Acidobacteriota bacterium]
MIDYPSHLVRCYILAHFGSNPFWPHFYRVEFGPIPNLAMDVIVTPLAHWLPIVVSGQIFLTLLALVYVLGCSELARAAWGRPQWLALVAGLTLYNATLLWGFVNYLFGLGLFFLVFAVWLRLRRQMTPDAGAGLGLPGPLARPSVKRVAWRSHARPRASQCRFALLCGLGTLVYLAHLAAVAVLGVACVTVALMDWWPQRGRGPAWQSLLWQTGWLGAPGLLLLFGYLQRNGRTGRIGGYTLWHKIAALFTLVRSYNVRSDAAITLGLAACAVVLLWHCRWRRELVVAGLVLLGCCLAMPNRILTSQNADIRLSVPAFVLLILAVRPRWGRLQAAALCLALALLGLHIGLIAHTWRGFNARARDVLALGEKLPPGARVDVLEDVVFTGPLANKWDFEVPKILDYWSVSRGAYESNVFAQAGQQPLIKRTRFRNCWPGTDPGCLRNFDYLVTLNPPPTLQRQAQALGVPVARWRGDTLWRLRLP